MVNDRMSETIPSKCPIANEIESSPKDRVRSYTRVLNVRRDEKLVRIVY
jgi:hypothetical protein